MLMLLIFISFYLISSSSTNFKLRLELNKIDFILSSKYILSLLSANQSQIMLKSLVNCFLGGAPTSIYHFFCPSVPLSVRLSVHPSVRPAPYPRNCTSSDNNFWCTSKMMIFPGVLFSFLKF